MKAHTTKGIKYKLLFVSDYELKANYLKKKVKKDNFNQIIAHIDFQKIVNACKYYDLLNNAQKCLIG